MKKDLVTLLVIAGSDCSGGAGIQADIHAASLCKVYPLTAITALTVQNSRGVTKVMPTDTAMLSRQLEAIIEEVTPDAVKIGMIGSVDNGKEIARFLKSVHEDIPVIIDPVLAPTSGGYINKNINAIKETYLKSLFPLATIVTPNINEALSFLNEDTPLDDVSMQHCEIIARKFLNLSGGKAVVLKGGHLAGDRICDTLVAPTCKREAIPYYADKINCTNLHGTGCCFSSILASEMAKKTDLETAFHNSCSIMHSIIEKSCRHKLGKSPYGPLNIHDYILK